MKKRENAVPSCAACSYQPVDCSVSMPMLQFPQLRHASKEELEGIIGMEMGTILESMLRMSAADDYLDRLKGEDE